VTIKMRRGTAASGAAVVLESGEFGYATDSKKLAIGDGVTAFATLDGLATDTDLANLGANDIDFTPAGLIIATDVQAAIEEVASDAASSLSTTAGTLIPKSLVDAKGDILVATANDTPARLGVGGNGQVLIADSAQSTGVKWGTAPGLSPDVFNVADYGAVGDDTTNDLAAIQACVDAAVAYGLANNYFARVVFPGKSYYLGNAAVPTAQGTNAQGVAWATRAYIRLPMVETTGRKLILEFVGSGGDAMAHWLSTTPQKGGTVLRTDVTGLSPTNVNGISMVPAIVGGPIFASGNHWSNVKIKVDGVQVMGPANPGIIGWDFKRLANMGCGQFGAMASASVAGTPDLETTPTNDLGIGLRSPEQLNNDMNYVTSFTSEGFYTGMAIGDHFAALRIAIIYAEWGIFIQGPGSFAHGGTISSLSIEATTKGIVVGNTGGFNYPLFIARADIETVTNFFDDPGNRLNGEIHWHSIASTTPGGTSKNCRLVNERVPRGAITGTVAGVTLPTLPSSGVASAINPWNRDVEVVIATGGAATVTQLAVDGMNTGRQCGNNSYVNFTWPQGMTYTATYTGTPTINFVTR